MRLLLIMPQSILVLSILLLAGCAGRDQSTVTDQAGATCPIPVPATYSAVIPCQDCSPTSAVLTLRPDFLYLLRISTTDSKTGEQESKSEAGLWTYLPADNSILLSSHEQVTRNLAITGANSLRVVKVAGGIIPPDVNYDLALEASPLYLDDVVRMQGMYGYQADAGQFRECLTGAVFPVSTEGESAALQRAYLNTPHGQGDPLLVTIDARLLSKLGRRMEYQEYLEPVNFINILPGMLCNGQKSDKLTLMDNSWFLISIAGKEIPLSEDQKRPFLRLAVEENRMEGFAGCNRFAGNYFIRGEFFIFNKMITRRMACVHGIELEDAFLQVLSGTRRYHIEKNILEMRDEDGKVLALLKHGGVFIRPLHE